MMISGLRHWLRQAMCEFTALGHLHQITVAADELTLHKNLWHRFRTCAFSQIHHHFHVAANVDRLERYVVLF